MEPKNSNRENLPSQYGHQQNPIANEITGKQKSLRETAHEAAEKDIAADPEFAFHSPNDDLDEGETSRLGEDIPGIT